MNRSAALVAEVPPGVVTVTWTVPLPAGLIAVICVSLSTEIIVPAVEPNETPVAPVKPIPVRTTVVPPLSGPLAGLMLDTIGPCPGGREVTINLTLTEAFPPFEAKLMMAEYCPSVKVVVSTTTLVTCGSPPGAIFPRLVSSVSHFAFPLSAIQLRYI